MQSVTQVKNQMAEDHQQVEQSEAELLKSQQELTEKLEQANE